MEKNENKIKDFNIRCDNFKNALIKTVNKSDLPIGTIYYIWKYIDKDVENLYYGTLNSAFAQNEQIVSEVKTRNED